jgi:hypothetical protein
MVNCTVALPVPDAVRTTTHASLPATVQAQAACAWTATVTVAPPAGTLRAVGDTAKEQGAPCSAMATF